MKNNLLYRICCLSNPNTTLSRTNTTHTPISHCQTVVVNSNRIIIVSTNAKGSSSSTQVTAKLSHPFLHASSGFFFLLLSSKFSSGRISTWRYTNSHATEHAAPGGRSCDVDMTRPNVLRHYSFGQCTAQKQQQRQRSMFIITSVAYSPWSECG